MDLNVVRDKVNEMSELAYNMLTRTYEGFMKHDSDLLDEALKYENRLNKLEKAVNIAAAEVSKTKKLGPKDKNKLVVLIDITAGFEAIGDYCKDMIERIEIKILENLLFSDKAVAEYTHLYEVVRGDFNSIVNALKMNDFKIVNGLLCAGDHAGELVEKYRKNHNDRLLQGICSPLACNMYLNLLDLTAQIHERIKKIAQDLQKIGL